MYDTISLSHNRRRTLSSDGVPLMEMDRRKLGGSQDKRKKAQLSGNCSPHRQVLNSSGDDTAVSKRLSFARQESNPFGFVCCSRDPKIPTSRMKSNGVPKGEECIQLLKKEQSKDRAVREETDVVDVGSGESISQPKKPLKSCLRHSKNESSEAFVIENPSVGDVTELASSAQLRPENGSFSLSSSTVSSTAEVPKHALSNSSRSLNIRTSNGQRNGTTSANGHISFQENHTTLSTINS